MDATNGAITSDALQIVSKLEDDHVDRLEELIRSATLSDGHGPIGEHKFLRLKHGDDLGVAVLAYHSDELAEAKDWKRPRNIALREVPQPHQRATVLLDP